MQTKHSKVFTILVKNIILNVWLSFEYDYIIYRISDFKDLTPHVLLKFYKFAELFSIFL